MKFRDYKTAKERRNALEKETGVHLTHAGTFSLEESVAAARNCENMIGAAQVPMGVAGPLRIEGKEYYIPLATTEGALVASVSRGSKAISESGGAVVDSYRVGVTRGPVFYVNNLKENKELLLFLEQHFDQLSAVAKETSHHLTLKKVRSRGVGKYRYVRFSFDTQDAMGMNMATIATEAIAKYIEEKTQACCLSVAGNFDIDKKPAWLNVIEGRGMKAWAEVVLPHSVITKTLKTTAKKMYDLWLAKCMIGSAMAGSMGHNLHFANVIAALFLATGQDIGHVGEASCGITIAEVVGEDLYMSVYLPDLMVGTVGGGTGLATQHEALSLLGVAGGNEGKNSQKLAEIIAAAVLAGEISLLASLSEGTLAQAHQTLARGGK